MTRRAARIAAAWAAGCAGGSPVTLVDPGTGPCDPADDLALARSSTEVYADEAAALAAGYVAQDACDADADGAAMGIHYVRVADSLDQTLDVAAPDFLLYVPDGANGDGVRLVGIEYGRPALVGGSPVFEAPADPTAFDPAPRLFCRVLDGPMAGHAAGQPWHYDLHVWLYADNPAGMFAPYNPDEDCAP